MTGVVRGASWSYRIAFVAAVIPLVYWLPATYYAVFFFSIVPPWALPLTIMTCGTQIVGLSVARGEMTSGAVARATRRAAAHAVGLWSVTFAFIVLFWK